MDRAEAARLLGVAADAPWPEVRRAYRHQIRRHHPDRSAAAPGAGGSDRALLIIEAFRVLEGARSRRATAPREPAPPPPPPPPPQVRWPHVPPGGAPAVIRVDGDTLRIDAPAEEAFRWVIDAAHDVGEITYLDRSDPILEVLGTFEGEPATSLLVTFQGRMDGTDLICSAESIEARPGPPTAAVVDLLELALRRRQVQPGQSPSS